ncbi:2-furoyl-CoA dehydrogenase FAD binding subunit [Azospirillum lipoferum]|uniref:Carbon monoxide dehydrogenase n=1 Tax=Azospirillum lipoferum TaxID=193 RepID=A0A5A9FSI7_AZOLI|nr:MULTISPECIES: FAD binding domain-containing protein [Azospirillum]KAA0584694.1 carbon monoxide dehydrogenase [Azospirillum lipoferum]MCP1615475.1 2-furoyl-CoA dehydrogenase FAD binding subunit [Azospirillum lipoferum]MDW5531207.1 FAD binding domain-containing protein [Azospirillum sp. NL1]MDW5532199.1 FAD binding domain-containing protein [Azospirillum sp. NL1]
MKPAPFDYLRPATVTDALAALAAGGDDARVIAGGQSLMPMLNMRLVQPRLLIDLGRLEELRVLNVENGWLTVGAAVTQAEVLARPTLAQEVPLLAAALPWVGHFQTRNRGTLCGSVAHADPSAETPLCLVATGGEVVLRNAKRRRTVAAADFFLGPLTTVKAADEIVECVRFRLARPGSGHAFREQSMRHGDFAIAACAATVDERSASLTVGGVADRPTLRSWPLVAGGLPPDLDKALNAFAWDLGGDDDQHATARYRRDLVRRIGRTVLEEALSCRR